MYVSSSKSYLIYTQYNNLWSIVRPKKKDWILIYYLHQNRSLQSIGKVNVFVEEFLFVNIKKTYHKIDVNMYPG
jgi:hypothetical protein